MKTFKSGQKVWVRRIGHNDWMPAISFPILDGYEHKRHRVRVGASLYEYDGTDILSEDEYAAIMLVQ